ncbi:SusC/RagA family TonB-linked outer membrane protein [Dyadobacter jejuensis]|nr:TonB-dependent receptor [Dyadobacter jejuensis]
MRLSILQILLAGTVALASSVHKSDAQDLLKQQITLRLNNVTLQEALTEIEALTQVKFAYSKSRIQLKETVNIHAKEKYLSSVLTELLTPLGIEYKLMKGHIMLMLTTKPNTIRHHPDAAPKREEATVASPLQNLTGIVTDIHGETLPGVSIVVKGSQHGTTTDVEGRYSLELDTPDVTIIFSYVGYISQEITVGERTTLNVTMQVHSKALDEVVVVGYGTKMKGALTGAITSIDQKVFEARPLTNTLTALQGTMPGVTILRGSGRPGNDNFSLQIRGVSSIGGSKPLILVDGVPGDLNLLNPNDIANISVLKDAAASIYGSRAADGVVLVTTKKGTSGKPTISYSLNVGIKKPQFLKNMTNTLQMTEMYDQGMRNIGQPGVSSDVFDKIRANAEPDPTGGWLWVNNPGFYQSTDWTNIIYGTGMQQMHNLSIMGGGENNSYLFSAGYNKDEGIMNYGDNHSDRYNLRMNYDFQLFKALRFETRTSFDSRTNIEPVNLMSATSLTPRVWSFIPVKNPLDQYYRFRGWGNPVEALLHGKYKYNYSKLSTNFKGEAQLAQGLKLVAQMGITLGFGDTFSSYPTYTSHNWEGGVESIVNNPNRAFYDNSKNVYGLYNAYLEYDKAIGRKHHLNIMAGSSHEENGNNGQSAGGYNFASNDLFTLNLADKTRAEYISTNGYETEWSLRSYFGRLGYSFDRKYYVDFTTRIDGSSKFAPGKRWSAVFPAASVSWNLSQEEFMKSATWMQLAKFRASWGHTGNQELSFGNYDYIPLVSIQGLYPIGTPNTGLSGAVSSIASANRTWETVKNTNIGFDFAVFNSRLSGSIDYFIKVNDKMLVRDELPALLGGTAPTQNIGKLRTHGWDLSLNWSDRLGDFKYSITAMVSDNKNKLVELKGNSTYSEGLVHLRQGYSLNSYFGYVDDGIISNETQLAEYKKIGNTPTQLGIGDMMYRDVDGDGKITAFGDPAAGTTGDMQYLGNLMPRYNYSSNISLSYKNFDFTMFFQGIGKREGIRYGDFSAPFRVWWYQPLEYFYGKTWSADNVDAPYPRIIPGGKGYDVLRDWNWSRASNRRMNNLAYLRMKTVSLAYNIPKELCAKVKMQSAKIYFSGQDLLTFSKGTWNKSFDPEETWERNDEQTYPFTSVISFGLDIKF